MIIYVGLQFITHYQDHFHDDLMSSKLIEYQGVVPQSKEMLCALVCSLYASLGILDYGSNPFTLHKK